jgi:nitrogen-specific signal transduction histidine kinase
MLTMLADKQVVRNVLDHLPTGVGVWYVQPFFCVFNRGAVQLTGFSDCDFQQDDSLWLSRVHPRDQELVSSLRRQLRTEKQKVACNYRFLPNGGKQEIWIRDVSLPFQNPDGEIGGIVSVYTDISALMAGTKQDTQITADLRAVIEGLAHDVRNYVHVISGALEFLRLTGSLTFESHGIIKAVEQINRLVGELEEYFFPPDAQLSVANAVLLLRDVIQQMQDELLPRGIHLKLFHPGALPQVQLDARQIRRAIERILDFSVALLPQGGKLNIKARRREINGTEYVELQIISYSPCSLEVDEKEVFQPFLQVRKYKAGLSLALAREALYRNRGQISFRKNNSQQALFSLLLEVCSSQ